MVRLLCGSHGLAVCKQSNLNRAERLCLLCDNNEVEDLFHFTMVCPKWDVFRQSLMSNVSDNLSDEGSVAWDALSIRMKFLLIIGLEFPLPNNDLTVIRQHACLKISKMYKKRRDFEPP